MSTPIQPTLELKKGICYALYVYDVGLAIDLEKCRKVLSGSGAGGEVRHSSRTLKYFDYKPAPLRLMQQTVPSAVANYRTDPDVELVFYDFGAIAVNYTIPFQGTLEDVRALSVELNGSTLLQSDSRKRVMDLLKRTKSGISKPHEPDLVEDYAMFHVQEWATTLPVAELPAHFAHDLAQVLRAEKQLLSEQEVADAVACLISFAKDDIILIDWNAALIFDQDAYDALAVLEFANVELLEMRFLDRELDDSLDRTYEVLSRRAPLKMWNSSSDLRSVAQMQVDGAIVFERVSNALKLMSDQYLARVYRLASQRFHLTEWNNSILRKLDTIESLYDKMNDRNASLRLEMLEWIVILLIAFEVVWPFISK